MHRAHAAKPLPLTRAASALALALGLFAPSCGGDSDDGDGGEAANGGTAGRPPDTGAACESPDDCYPDVAISGEAQCLDRVRGGYCTHLCESDNDCCTADGECDEGLPSVCSPFESTGMMMCFVSCEDEDVDSFGAEDEQDYCQRRASSDFICRSSGGGAENRKVCVPGDCGVGARCQTEVDCDADLDCALDAAGGYCTRSCTLDADCPGDARCVGPEGGEGVCRKSCTVASDCSFCRGDSLRGTCSGDVTFVEAGSSGSVCLP